MCSATPSNRAGAARDRAAARALGRWFACRRRDLPWRLADPRTGRRDPYLVLVSEVMLQQTQAGRVAERFPAFIERFPSVRALAAAKEDEVLAEWSGLGYYRRARLLQRAARAIVEGHGGDVPADAAALRHLPGVGPYTAGAVLSIAFGRPEPAVDANVRRVLARLEGQTSAEDAWAWRRAEELVSRARGIGPGRFNEALMDLGALVCTPRRPRCGDCPLRSLCAARLAGRQEHIPRARPRSCRPVVYCAAVLAVDARGRILMERRADRGLWAGLWQAPTVEGARRIGRAELAVALGGLDPGRLVARFARRLTHRDARFEVWRMGAMTSRQAERLRQARPGARWVSPARARDLGLSSPQASILRMAAPAAQR